MWAKVAMVFVLVVILTATVWQEVNDQVSFTVYLWLFWLGSGKLEGN